MTVRSVIAVITIKAAKKFRSAILCAFPTLSFAVSSAMPPINGNMIVSAIWAIWEGSSTIENSVDSVQWCAVVRRSRWLSQVFDLWGKIDFSES
jgi:hypothetical protein